MYLVIWFFKTLNRSLTNNVQLHSMTSDHKFDKMKWGINIVK